MLRKAIIIVAIVDYLIVISLYIYIPIQLIDHVIYIAYGTYRKIINKYFAH
jgi:H2-forming N5,N10-methylenetetrahydromethanopterin dehydrogenase-like enzyme